MYTRSPPQGSVLSKSLLIWRQAMKGRWTLNPVKLAKNMNSPDFWESAKPSRFQGESRPSWMTFDDQWVELPPLEASGSSGKKDKKGKKRAEIFSIDCEMVSRMSEDRQIV